MKTKASLNWKDWSGLLIGFISWLYLAMILLDLFPTSLRYGMDPQLWMIGILNAFWLLCAVGFLFACAGWWEQRRDARKTSWVTLGGLTLSGGFIFFPVLGYLAFLLFALKR